MKTASEVAFGLQAELAQQRAINGVLLIKLDCMRKLYRKYKKKATALESLHKDPDARWRDVMKMVKRENES